MHEAEARQFVGAREQPLDVGLVELDDLGDQQDLPRDAGLLERGLHALVDQPLVRGVLVDDHEAVARLRHDVGLVHLRARGAERPVEQVGARLRRLDARVGRRRADVERRLRGFGKAAARRVPRRAPRQAAATASGASPSRARGSDAGPERRDGRAAAGRRGALRRRAPAPPAARARSDARTSPASRKRTSVLAGCTLTSTSRGVERDEQRHHRMAVARQIVGIGAAHRAEQQLVAHRPAVDEQILPERVGAACSVGSAA